MWHTSWTRLLGVRYPIIQGPLGGGHSTPALAAAVSEAGALGSLGLYHLPPDAIRESIAETRRLTGRPFGVNLWVPLATDSAAVPTPEMLARAWAQLRHAVAAIEEPADIPSEQSQDFSAQVEAVLAAAPAVLSFTFGTPPREVVQACRSRGIVTVGTIVSVDEAEAMAAAGVDAVCASGFEAGGHRGAFLRPAEASLMGSMALIPQVVRAVRLPIIAAGGMADGRGVVAALALGAAAAQLGTAFLACRESGATPLHREVLHDPTRTRDTVLTRAFTGRLARSVRNRYADAWAGNEGALLPYPWQGRMAASVRAHAYAAGQTDLLPLWAGQAAPLLKERDAASLVASLVQEAEAVRDRLTIAAVANDA